jgi:DNA-binding NarL/FixJ family response regulator
MHSTNSSVFHLPQQWHTRFPEVEIIVLSMHSSPLYAKRALRAGASGYVVKRETTRRICQAIREVLNGVPYMSKEVGPSSGPSPSEENFDLALLSEREREIFCCLGRGHPTRQIAHDLGISIKTVQVHCGNIRDKMGLPGASELYSAAVRWNERHREELGSRCPQRGVFSLRFRSQAIGCGIVSMPADSKALSLALFSRS